MKKQMKATLFSMIFLGVFFSASAQLVITNNETPEQLILNTFVGENLSVSNIKYNGTTASALNISDQVARFSEGTAGLSCEQGLILCTGKAIVAAGPNNNALATNPTATPVVGDTDLGLLTGTVSQVHNVCKIEFDFIPNGNTVLFDYIFASEEYPSYVGTAANDSFGLFLSGPGISGPYSNGAKNIAIIPGTSSPVSINTLNNGVNNSEPCQNCQYYISNGRGNTPELNTEIQFNGRSSILTASGAVTPGETYHLKFVVGNLMDNLYDSAMFLTQGSLRSATLANQQFSTDRITMIPNPAKDFIRIHSKDQISKVGLYDMQGRSLQSITTHGTDMTMDTSSLQSGTYIVEVTSITNQSSRQKLVIR